MLDWEEYTQEQRNEIAQLAFDIHRTYGPAHIEGYHPAVIGSQCMCFANAEKMWKLRQETDAHQRMVARSGPLQQVEESGLRKGRGELI